VPSSDPLKGLPADIVARYDSLIVAASDGVIDRMRIDSTQREAEEAAEVLLRIATGLDVKSDHGAETPARFVRMLQELTTPEPIKWKTFPNEGMDEMIIVDEIPFTSLCNHHVVPFIGFARVGYVPNELVAGLSKFARVVRHFAKGLQIQERLTMQIADFLEERLQPKGVIVLVKAEHMCMTIRGVQSPGTKTTTTAVKGVFADHTRTAKMEFLMTINGGQHK
jgi:GTP cyclohydrolase IA